MLFYFEIDPSRSSLSIIFSVANQLGIGEMTMICQIHDSFRFRLMDFRRYGMLPSFSFKVFHVMLWCRHAYCHVCCPKHGCKCPSVRIIQVLWSSQMLKHSLQQQSLLEVPAITVSWTCWYSYETFRLNVFIAAEMSNADFFSWPLGWYQRPWK